MTSYTRDTFNKKTDLKSYQVHCNVFQGEILVHRYTDSINKLESLFWIKKHKTLFYKNQN